MPNATCDSQGRSFSHGVRFSVHTISRGRAEYLIHRESNAEYHSARPVGRKLQWGITVALESMKLREAQKSPDSALTNSAHTWSKLK